MDKVVVYNFEKLVLANDPITIEHDWIRIEFENLIIGENYDVPLYLWAAKDRPMRTVVYKDGTTDVRALGFPDSFTLGTNPDYVGNPQWTLKQYRLEATEHKGRIYMDIGWPAHASPSPGGIKFQIFSKALTSQQLTRKARIAAGCCPECNIPGQWQAMALVCLKHGRFLG